MRLSEYAERIEKTHRKKFLLSTMPDKNKGKVFLKNRMVQYIINWPTTNKLQIKFFVIEGISA